MGYSDLILHNPNLVSYWRLGESSGTTAEDWHGSNDGTYTGGFTLGAAGLLANDTDTAADFDGTDGIVSLPDLSVAEGSFTYEAWVKFDATPGGFDYVISEGNSGTQARQAHIRFGSSSGDGKVVGTWRSSGGVFDVTSTDAYSSGTHHLALTRSGATLTLYVDGAQAAQRTDLSGTMELDRAAIACLRRRTVDADINFFDGVIDEVAVYNTALSATVLLQHYNVGAGLETYGRPVILVTPQPAPLALSVTSSDGQVKRWGPGEPDSADIPGGLQFTTSIPGGYKDLTCDLFRRIDFEYGDLGLLDDVRAYGPGNETAWEGRFTQFPRTHGDGFAITPGAVGHQAHLKDDPSFREVYVDRDPGSWHDPPLNRRIQVHGTDNRSFAKIRATVESGALVFEPPNSSLTTSERAELHYAMPAGLKVAKLGYKGTNTGTLTNLDADDFVTDDDDDFAAGFATATLSVDGTLREQAVTTPTRYAYLAMHVTSTVTPPAGTSTRYEKVAVYGDHGLTGRDISGEPDGFFASDLIADIVSRAAPLLNYTTGEGGSIESTSFVIPHMVFREPTTAEEAILTVNAFHLWEWGVYDDKTFFFREPRADRLTWEARLSDGAHLSLEGDQIETLFNGVIVTYREPDGTEKTVGPPGSGFDAEDATLEDTSEENVVNQHGIPRRWAHLKIDPITTEAGAIQLGAIFLAEKSLPQRRGTIELRGTVTHPTIVPPQPAWKVRAGDWIRVPDHPADEPRRIIETRWDNDQKLMSCTLDNSSYRIEALFEWLGAHLVGTLGG